MNRTGKKIQAVVVALTAAFCLAVWLWPSRVSRAQGPSMGGDIAPRATWRGGKDAKIRLSPDIDLVDSYGFNAGELRRILAVVRENRAELLRAWDEHFGNRGSL